MRVKSPTRKRHKKILKLARGYRMARSKHYRVARESVLHAGQYAYIGRKLRKRDKRREWISQISAALKYLSMENKLEQPLNYSRFIHLLNQKQIKLDRKSLAQLSKTDISAFEQVVKQAMA